MRTPLEENVDVLISQFDDWFQQTPNEPLTPAEKAIVKTFCWFLLEEAPPRLLHAVSAVLSSRSR